MKQQATALELRIHSGLHAGAREALQADSLVLGAANDCDFVLADAGLLPRHVRLLAEGGGHRLQLLDNAAGTADIALAPGSLHRVGPVLISVDAADAPWPDAARVQAALLAADSATGPAESSAASTAAADTAADALLDVVPADDRRYDKTTAASALAQTDASPSSPSSSRPSRRTWLVLLMLVPIALLLWAVWSVALSPAPRDTAIVAPPSPATTPQRLRDAAIAVVQSLKLEQRVRVSEGANGKVAVQAALLDDDEYEALAMALSRLNPRPALNVVREQDLQAAVAEAVAREAADIGSPLSVASLGRGKFRIEGNVADTAARDALLARLRQGLPSLIVLESALATREDRALRLLADLRSAGIGDIQGRFADGQLRVEALLSAADVPRWEQVLVRIAQRYPGVPFEASTRLKAPEATTRLPAVLATLPFKLRTVVSGPASYVVLNDGAKLMIGGSHQGWRLVAVDPGQVTFEGQAGRRALVPR